MPASFHSPKDLARAVYSELKMRGSTCPPLVVLNHLFESMYFASLKSEESQPITFDVVYLNPNNPDPHPPRRIRKDRWSYVRFDKAIPITIANLAKVAKASDPRTSSFAVYHDKHGQLISWGLIDQGIRYYDFVNYSSDSGPERPGLFQASIAGVGHLVAQVGYEKIAELKTGTLVRKELNVLQEGPVRDKLKSGILTYLEKVKHALPNKVYTDRTHWDASLTRIWIESLCRLLLRAKSYRHGGAILITPDTSLGKLKIKYRTNYPRLHSALVTQAILDVSRIHAFDKIIIESFQRISDRTQKPIPVRIPGDRKPRKRPRINDEALLDLYREVVHLEDELDDNRNELDGAIWFISLLTRVDGLVLLNQNLEVLGFGVEITSDKVPSNIFMSGDRLASVNRLRRIDYNHYGTRHRSMMRYCSQHPESIGFVISQDGDVRVITQVRSKLAMWENIKLQLPKFVRHRLKRAQRSKAVPTDFPFL